MGGLPVPTSQLGNHLYSNPRNPIIAKIFRLVNLSETIGYGFDMLNEWKAITGNNVTFESDISTSTVTFWLDSNRASNNVKEKKKNMSNLTLSITTIGDLLLNQKITNGGEPIEGVRLNVPIYQRPYKWTARNAIQLLDDIIEAMNSNKEKYRVGTLILQHCRWTATYYHIFFATKGFGRRKGD